MTARGPSLRGAQRRSNLVPQRRPSAGGFEGGGVFEVGEEGAGGLQVGGVEAFGEPAEDRGEQGGRLLRPALLAAQAGEARGGPQFPGLFFFPARGVAGFPDGPPRLAPPPRRALQCPPPRTPTP